MASHSRGLSAASLAGIGILTIVLAGCSTSTTGEGAGDGNTLTFASGQQAAAQALIDGFEEANPEYTIKADFIEQDSAYIQQLRTQLSAGTAPDVFKVWPSGGDAMAIWQVAKDGLVAPRPAGSGPSTTTRHSKRSVRSHPRPGAKCSSCATRRHRQARSRTHWATKAHGRRNCCRTR